MCCMLYMLPWIRCHWNFLISIYLRVGIPNNHHHGRYTIFISLSSGFFFFFYFFLFFAPPKCMHTFCFLGKRFVSIVGGQDTTKRETNQHHKLHIREAKAWKMKAKSHSHFVYNFIIVPHTFAFSSSFVLVFFRRKKF